MLLPSNNFVTTCFLNFNSYCGHGSGSAYLVEETLQQQPCRAAVMLMGCSSGRLVADGDLDASGTLLHYLLAGS
jgi:separase